jgi:Ribosomal protein L25 (general stress protein Ctc)
MSDDNTLAAELRDVTGKGAARTLRREGKIPAVIYGDKKPPVGLTLDFNELNKRYQRGGFLKNTLKVEVDGKSHLVLPKLSKWIRCMTCLSMLTSCGSSKMPPWKSWFLWNF